MPYRAPISRLSCATIARLQDRCGLRYFVETGTFRGDTAQRAASYFGQVWTVEIDPGLHVAARRRLADWPNVCCHLSQSPPFLAEAIKWCDRPTLFWLDAHWAGPGTGRAARECPLLDELAAFAARGLDTGHVVLIDDVRMFQAAPPPEHDAAQWPRLEQIQEAIGRWPGSPKMTVADDILELTPW